MIIVEGLLGTTLLLFATVLIAAVVILVVESFK